MPILKLVSLTKSMTYKLQLDSSKILDQYSISYNSNTSVLQHISSGPVCLILRISFASGSLECQIRGTAHPDNENPLIYTLKLL